MDFGQLIFYDGPHPGRGTILASQWVDDYPGANYDYSIMNEDFFDDAAIKALGADHKQLMRCGRAAMAEVVEDNVLLFNGQDSEDGGDDSRYDDDGVWAAQRRIIHPRMRGRGGRPAPVRNLYHMEDNAKSVPEGVRGIEDTAGHVKRIEDFQPDAAPSAPKAPKGPVLPKTPARPVAGKAPGPSRKPPKARTGNPMPQIDEDWTILKD